MTNQKANPSPPPPRGFTESEFATRTQRAQEAMAEYKLDALLFTTEPNVRYFSGFLSQFWESPTRPWFLVIPYEGKPIAVVPEIGASGFAETWIDDIRSWPAPQPTDDGISLLRDLLGGLTRRHGTLGVTMGQESHLRMPLGDYHALLAALPGVEVVDSTDIIRGLRAVKSESEVEKIAFACEVAGKAFDALPDHARTGLSEREIVRQFRIDLLSGGCDSAPYVIAGSGPGGYDSIIMGPTDRIIRSRDVLIIDTGATFEGYFCDFDRNFAFDYADDLTRHAYEVCWQATEAGLQAARPGVSAESLCSAMAKVLEEGGALGNDVGRLGHGLGMNLTEWPSNKEGDLTVLKPGMVMTLEPGMLFAAGRMMVHEENILITDGAPKLLTRRAERELPIIS